MAIEIGEKLTSPTNKLDENGVLLAVTKEYLIVGTTSWSDAVTQLVSYVPADVDGCTKGNISVDPLEGTLNIWNGSVEYDYNPDEKPSGSSMDGSNWSIGAGSTVNITQGLDTTAFGTNAPDYNDAINVDATGTVLGVGITDTAFSYSHSQIWDTFGEAGSPLTWLSDTKILQLASLRGTVNSDDDFLGFQAGEVKLESIQSKYWNQRQTQLTYNFSIAIGSKNTTYRPYIVMDLNEISTNITKKGWEYIWVKYIKKPDEANLKAVTIPGYAYVVQLFRENDFGAALLV